MEMWSEAGFDPDTIKRELHWAAELGMNAVRVFLHDLAWNTDKDAFLNRLDSFLTMAAEEGIRTMPVLFDDCWHEMALLGSKPEPKPGVHNSIWLQSPGLRAAKDKAQRGRLEGYVKAVVSRFAQDERILAWDIYNELGNFFLPILGMSKGKKQFLLAIQWFKFHVLPIPTLELFREAVVWARDCDPSQPITSAVYMNQSSLNKELMAHSDIVSFHNYRPAAELSRQIDALSAENQPLLCTEYMARTAGSTFASCLPVFKDRHIGCFNWGLVNGRTQTIYTWTDGGYKKGDGKQKPAQPELWYHDMLNADGSPFDEEELRLFVKLVRGKEGSA
ncbi:cellulase family glycosylhydrolase [Treponema sp.]